jgi:transcriptional regulator NrdR family protein
MSTTHRVVTSQKHYEPFQRDILFESIKDSCAHRKTALDDATALTDTVLSLLLRQFSSELEKPLIATVTHEVLSRFDPIAAAVYHAKHTY